MPNQLKNARHLRKNMTDAELRIWRALRLRQILGVKFRRQHPIGPYIADFVCIERKLIVEVDGGQHAEQIEKDAARTAWLEAQGYCIMRFWNNEVLQNTKGVLETIRRVLEEGFLPPSQPSP
ncbi:MAG: hypothetical protein A2Z44_02215 [Betaproteobacteria bacterium RBG_19FT_COMBO_58_11]|nr:MAG: hypothetical protein A2Z44_02215 [Betaproteobacteria bacterium RBG_19FT_COMBO_58_11]